MICLHVADKPDRHIAEAVVVLIDLTVAVEILASLFDKHLKVVDGPAVVPHLLIRELKLQPGEKVLVEQQKIGCAV